MPEIIRAFIVVMVLAFLAFYLGRQLANGNISPHQFKVWRNVWFAATVAGFLAGSLYIYAIAVAFLLLYARAERAFGPCLYLLLLFVVPPVLITIGGMGVVNKIMQVDNPQLLAAFILLPALLSAKKPIKNTGQVADLLIVVYVLLIIALQCRSPDSSVTDIMRSVVVYTLSILLPYFAFSRTITTAADLRKVLVALVVASFPLGFVAVFEMIKGWHLYYPIIDEWGGSGGYLRREGILRATASAVHPIALGYVLMVALGCLLGLQRRLNRNIAWLCFALLGAGLIASLSRGPWVGAAILMIAYLATGANALITLAKFAAIGIICLVPLLMTPIGTRLLEFLPFIGSVESGNLEYRQRLMTNSLAVAERHMWFGSVDYLSEPEMQELKQGEGIVDVVNTYLSVLLKFGLVGLTLFVAFFASILLALRRALRVTPAIDTELRDFLRACMVTLVAILVTIATVSSISYIAYVYWSFAGICVAVSRIARGQRRAAVLNSCSNDSDLRPLSTSSTGKFNQKTATHLRGRAWGPELPAQF